MAPGFFRLLLIKLPAASFDRWDDGGILLIKLLLDWEVTLEGDYW